MPKHQQDLALPDTDKDTALAIAYETFKNLGWPVMYAGDDRLVGGTPKSHVNTDQQIIAAFENGSLVVQSVMIHNESFDLPGINKKNTAAFVTAFQNTKKQISGEDIEMNKPLVNSLRQQTAIVVEQEQKDADEIKTAMKPAGNNLYITYCLIAVNTLIFILMVIDGAGFFAENPLVHLKWGSNYAPLTLSGDYWRLITNTFIHFGIIHLVMNMYCLYIIGAYLEPMLGRVKFISAYLCTGILASIVSLWWHSEPTNSAGASGAIFGMYGLFLALLTTDLIPQSVRKGLLQNIGIFIFYNLAYGMKSGVDNSAHVGGLVSGFIFGYLFVLNIRAEKKGLSANWVLPAILITTAVISIAYLQQNKVPFSERQQIVSEIKDGSHKDTDQFGEEYNKFVHLQDTALAPLRAPGAAFNDSLKQQLIEISIPAWKSAETIATRLQQMDVGVRAHKKAGLVSKYVALREEEINLILGMINKQPGEAEKHDSLSLQINSILTELAK